MNGWAKWVAGAVLTITLAVATTSLGWVYKMSERMVRLEQKAERDDAQDRQLQKQWRMLSKAERYINEGRVARGVPLVDLGDG